MNLDTKVSFPAVIAVFAVLLGLWMFWVFAASPDTGPREVHYPYWCRECKAVYDVAEIKKDYPKNWRIPKDAPSDSIVLCVRCNKGWAYPVARCPQCGQNFVLHLQENVRCPICFPQAAQEAAQENIDLAPPEVKATKIAQ